MTGPAGDTSQHNEPCAECNGTGAIWTDPHVCTCGTGPGGYYGMHEPGCGSEPCPNGCPYVDARVAGRDTAGDGTDATPEPADPEEAVAYWRDRWAGKASELADAVGVIQDLARHATPIAHDADGFVATGYTVTVGAIHRAYGWLQGAMRHPRSVETWEQYEDWLRRTLRPGRDTAGGDQ